MHLYVCVCVYIYIYIYITNLFISCEDMKSALCTCVWSLSSVWVFATPWIVARQAPLFMEFSRQEFWSGLPFPTPGDLPDPGIKPTSLASRALAGRFFYHPCSLGSPALCLYTNVCICIYVCFFFFSHKGYTVCSSTFYFFYFVSSLW